MKKIFYLLLLFSSTAFGQYKVSPITWEGIDIGGSATVTVSSTATLTLSSTGSTKKYYIYTGSSAATWTLPAIGTTGRIYHIKNKGTGDLTIQRAGANQLFTDALVNSIILYTGDTSDFIDDGTNWSVF